MKAITFHEYGGREVLRYEDMPKPTPAAGQVLIAVKAAAVNPADWKLRDGWAKAFVPLTFPAIPGGDVAGVVEAAGNGVTHFKPGDAVFAMTTIMGGYAEYVALDAATVVKKPAALDFVQAASVPLAALTAWQALFDVADVQPEQRVLIHAGAGGVGSFAVQLATWKGAEVTATASAKNHDYLRGLGASCCIDYRATPIADMGRDFDVVLDLIGGNTCIDSLSLLKPGGAAVAVSGPPPAHEPPPEGKRILGARVASNGAQLAEIAALIERGIVRTEIAATFALRDAAKAHELIEQGHTRGKIVLTVGD